MILVTGATGRVGYRLMEALADARADVTAMVRVEAAVLTGSGHEDALYVVTGPEALGYADVAARVSAAFGRQVDYADQPPERALEAMLAGGLSRWQADGMLELFEWIREGGADTVTATVREMTGAEPRPLEDWLSEFRASFVGRPREP